MKRRERGVRALWVVIAFVVLLGGMAVIGADAVAPATLEEEFTRGDTVNAVLASDYYYYSSTLLLTNCRVYSGTTTNGTTQALDGVSIEIKVGTTTTNWTYAGTIISTNEGTFWSSITIPSLSSAFFQLKLTDANTNIYIYPWRTLRTKESM